MKYAAMLLLLCSYVSAKDKEVNLADYPTNFTVVTVLIDGCVMGIDGPDASYVVHPWPGTGCRLLPVGYVYKGRQRGRSIGLTYPHFKKGTVEVDKWKVVSYIIDVETAH